MNNAKADNHPIGTNDLKYDEMELRKYKDALCKKLPDIHGSAFLELLRKNQYLMEMNTQKVADNINGVIETFRKEGLSRAAYIYAAMTQPSLFKTQPGRIKHHVDSFHDNFKDYLPLSQVLRVATGGAPEIFILSPDRMKEKIDTAVRKLDCTYETYFKAVLQRPYILSCNYEELSERRKQWIEQGAPEEAARPQPTPVPAAIPETKAEEAPAPADAIVVENARPEKRRGRPPRDVTNAAAQELKEESKELPQPVLVDSMIVKEAAVPESVIKEEPVVTTPPPVVKPAVQEKKSPAPAVAELEIKESAERAPPPVFEPVATEMPAVLKDTPVHVPVLHDIQNDIKNDIKEIFERYNMVAEKYFGTVLFTTSALDMQRDIYNIIADKLWPVAAESNAKKIPKQGPFLEQKVR